MTKTINEINEKIKQGKAVVVTAAEIIEIAKQEGIKKAADSLIKKGNVNQGLLNMVEMAFRAYDPCFGCATHSLPGQMPLEVTIHDVEGNPVKVLKQFVD